MTQAPEILRAGTRRADERRDQLAASALVTLGELGYARTSLRDIAQNSDFSHGVVHYYFKDKAALIIHCVRYFKAQCVTRYDDVVAHSTSHDEFVEGFIAKLRESLVVDAQMHRLWYDLRNQGMYEDALRDDIVDIDNSLRDMVWRVVTKYAEHAGRPVAVDSELAYALFDGVFERALFHYHVGRAEAVDELEARARAILPSVLG